MATVWLAADLEHHREVAIKLLDPDVPLRGHPRYEALLRQMGLR